MNPSAVHAADTHSTANAPAQADPGGLSGPNGGVKLVGGSPEPSHDDLPAIECGLPPSEVLARLLARAKRGKLAGYAALGTVAGSSGAHFRASVFGQPYDRELIGSIASTPEGGSRVTFRSRLLTKLPAIMIVVTVLTFQPGLWLTDQMLKIYFDWYRIPTWWWYMPLVLLSLPVLWKQYTKSELAAAADARAVIEGIAETLKK